MSPADWPVSVWLLILAGGGVVILFIVWLFRPEHLWAVLLWWFRWPWPLPMATAALLIGGGIAWFYYIGQNREAYASTGGRRGSPFAGPLAIFVLGVLLLLKSFPQDNESDDYRF